MFDASLSLSDLHLFFNLIPNQPWRDLTWPLLAESFKRAGWIVRFESACHPFTGRIRYYPVQMKKWHLSQISYVESPETNTRRPVVYFPVKGKMSVQKWLRKLEATKMVLEKICKGNENDASEKNGAKKLVVSTTLDSDIECSDVDKNDHRKKIANEQCVGGGEEKDAKVLAEVKEPNLPQKNELLWLKHRFDDFEKYVYESHDHMKAQLTTLLIAQDDMIKKLELIVQVVQNSNSNDRIASKKSSAIVARELKSLKRNFDELEGSCRDKFAKSNQVFKSLLKRADDVEEYVLKRLSKETTA